MLSIIIVNHNTKTLLSNLLISIRENVNGVANEIIVVDNASQDDSIELLQTEFPDTIVIVNEENVGFGRANNQAARVAKGEYLLFLNSDTVIRPGSLEKMVDFLKETPAAGALGCKLLNRDGTLQRSCGIFPSLMTEFNSRMFLNRLAPNHKWTNAFKLSGWDYSSAEQVDWATGACLMLRTALFRQLDGFDERLYMFYEDAELCFRLHKRGSETWFLPTAEVFHLHGGSWQERRDIPIINSARSALLFFKKHRKRWQLPVLRTLIVFEVFIGWILLTPFLLLTGENLRAIRSRIVGYGACLKGVILDSLGQEWEYKPEHR